MRRRAYLDDARAICLSAARARGALTRDGGVGVVGGDGAAAACAPAVDAEAPGDDDMGASAADEFARLAARLRAEAASMR